MLVYGLENERINDSWYCKEGNTYHTFFLQCKERGCPQSCGHMTSTDLINWKYEGIVLEPKPGTWYDKTIATGSVAKYNGSWYMLFTGHSSETDKGEALGGIGVAVSDDLMTWEVMGDDPVIKRCWQATAYGIGYPCEYEGKTVTCYPLADPYVYPEPINGEYYIFINSYAAEYPINHRGGTAIFKTRDFLKFEPYKFAVIDSCDRMETVQVWEHNGRYYMYSGCVAMKIDENDATKLGKQINTNMIFVSDNIDGPYTSLQTLNLPKNPAFPDGKPYILKVFNSPEKKEIMMMNNIPYGVEGPFPVHYTPEGKVEFEF
ncbi:MAG: hypothetical protein IJ300_13375 [Clostridia bacterium]|nr:hypothetical protein [Clostridia bacterium]